MHAGNCTHSSYGNSFCLSVVFLFASVIQTLSLALKTCHRSTSHVIAHEQDLPAPRSVFHIWTQHRSTDRKLISIMTRNVSPHQYRPVSHSCPTFETQIRRTVQITSLFMNLLFYTSPCLIFAQQICHVSLAFLSPTKLPLHSAFVLLTTQVSCSFIHSAHTED